MLDIIVYFAYKADANLDLLNKSSLSHYSSSVYKPIRWFDPSPVASRTNPIDLHFSTR